MNIPPIDSGDLTLVFFEDCPIVALINRTTNEIREQTVDVLPSGANWRATVAKRMARIPFTNQTPYALLKGIR